MSVIPLVDRLPLAMSKLAAAVRDGTLPAGHTADIPRDLQAWREQSQTLLGISTFGYTSVSLLDVADPERIQMTSTRSGCSVAMTSDQMPPPECPHSAHGTLSISG